MIRSQVILQSFRTFLSSLASAFGNEYGKHNHPVQDYYMVNFRPYHKEIIGTISVTERGLVSQFQALPFGYEISRTFFSRTGCIIPVYLTRTLLNLFFETTRHHDSKLS